MLRLRIKIIKHFASGEQQKFNQFNVVQNVQRIKQLALAVCTYVEKFNTHLNQYRKSIKYHRNAGLFHGLIDFVSELTYYVIRGIKKMWRMYCVLTKKIIDPIYLY